MTGASLKELAKMAYTIEIYQTLSGYHAWVMRDGQDHAQTDQFPDRDSCLSEARLSISDQFSSVTITDTDIREQEIVDTIMFWKEECPDLDISEITLRGLREGFTDTQINDALDAIYN
jgi:hypothetical protein